MRAARSPFAAIAASYSPLAFALLLAALVLLAVAFRDAVAFMYDTWMTRPEYSHGILIPFVSAWLIWRRRGALANEPFQGSWTGLALVVVGGALLLLGELAAIVTVTQYALLMVFYGLVLAGIGPRAFRRIGIPLALLLLMVPLPNFILNNLSADLQLLSSRVAVALMRVAGVSVYLEGNVIDLGGYQLQVAEACDGLRYLFPLMTLAALMALMFRAPVWKRVVLFLSSIPITILMNSLRVGIIGISVEHWGPGMAEGFLHDFQGWFVFMLSALVMLLEVRLLAGVGPGRPALRDVLTLDSLPGETGPATTPAATTGRRPLAAAFVASVLLLGALTVVVVALPGRAEAVPSRLEFAGFPSHLDGWRGRQQPLEQVFLDTLKLDDYVLADYLPQSGEPTPVNFYAAWYASQRKGQSVHSPRSCIPGGGWQIRSLEAVELPDVRLGAQSLRVNRVLIEHGAHRQVVYYWFQQRGRVVTNEYLVKWYIFWDSLTRNRSDGAMVRLTVPVPANASDADADVALHGFLRDIAPVLPQYIPG